MLRERSHRKGDRLSPSLHITSAGKDFQIVAESVLRKFHSRIPVQRFSAKKGEKLFGSASVAPHRCAFCLPAFLLAASAKGQARHSGRGLFCPELYPNIALKLSRPSRTSAVEYFSFPRKRRNRMDQPQPGKISEFILFSQENWGMLLSVCHHSLNVALSHSPPKRKFFKILILAGRVKTSQ